MISSLPFSILFHVCKRFQLFTFQKKKKNFAQRDDNVNLIFNSKVKYGHEVSRKRGRMFQISLFDQIKIRRIFVNLFFNTKMIF
jgi:hypothetical protein